MLLCVFAFKFSLVLKTRAKTRLLYYLFDLESPTMKQIQIAERYLPFSHRPGIRCLIPFSFYGLQIFPTHLKFFDMHHYPSPQIGEVELQHCGPIKEFIVTLDLERGRVTVAGKNRDGYFRYHIALVEDKLSFCLEKGNISLDCRNISLNILPADKKSLLSRNLSSLERLSLGGHRKQEEELIRRRGKMEDILPLWHRLGLLLPEIAPAPYSGVASFLTQVGEGTPNDFLDPFRLIWETGFDGLFFPTLEDQLHQGIGYPPFDTKSALSPLSLLTAATDLIRSLFVQSSGKEISILPHLPREFHCGRMTSIEFQSGNLSIEWSKKEIRRHFFTPKESGEYHFSYPHVKTFRLRKSKKEFGKRLDVKEILTLEAGAKYSFDNFES